MEGTPSAHQLPLLSSSLCLSRRLLLGALGVLWNLHWTLAWLPLESGAEARSVTAPSGAGFLALAGLIPLAPASCMGMQSMCFTRALVCCAVRR